MEENLIVSLYEYTSFSELKKRGGRGLGIQMKISI